MRSRKKAHLAGNRANLIQRATVRTLAKIQHPPLERRFHRFVQRGGYLLRLVLLVVLFLYSGLYLGDLLPTLLGGQPQSLVQRLGNLFDHLLGQLLAISLGDIHHRRLAVLFGELLLEFYPVQIDFLRVLDGLKDDGLGHLARARLHHDDAGTRTRHNQVEQAAVEFFISRIDHELAVHVSDAGRRNRPLERNVRDGQRGGRADDGGHVVGVYRIHRERGGNDLDLVPEVLGE